MDVLDVIDEQRKRPEFREAQADFMTENTARYGKEFILKFLPSFNDFINQISTLKSYTKQLREWSKTEGETMIMYFDIWAGFQVIEKLEKDGILRENRIPEAEARALVLKYTEG